MWFSRSAWIPMVALLGCGVPEKEPHRLRIVLDVDMGADLGQPFGTFFELHDGDRILAAAGMQQLSGTHLSNNARVLSFFVGNEEHTTYTDMGMPFPEVHSHIRLFNWQNELHAFTRAPMHTMVRKLADDGTWTDAPEFENLLGDRVRNIEVIGDRLLVFHDNAISSGRDTILHDADVQHLIGILRNGTLLVHHFDPDGKGNRFLIASWHPEGPGEAAPLIWHQDPSPVPTSGFVYCMVQVDNGFLAGTNFGGLYRLDRDELEVIYLRKEDDPSWQPYCFLTMGDDVLIGHYPTGSILQWNSQGLTAHEPPLKKPAGVPQRSREAQALAIYGGSLFCGIWPWGEVHELDLATRQWKSVERVFRSPVIDANGTIAEHWDAPYVKDFHDARNGEYNNAWGQRVTGFTLHGNALYASTSNKGGLVDDPADVALLGEEVVSQYGRVFRILRRGVVSAQVHPRHRSRFIMECGEHGITIIQDTDTIAHALTGALLDLGSAPITLRLGTGLYGPSAAEVSLHQMTLTDTSNGVRMTSDKITVLP